MSATNDMLDVDKESAVYVGYMLELNLSQARPSITTRRVRLSSGSSLPRKSGCATRHAAG